MKIMLPIKTESEANKREHWAAKARRAKSQRRIAMICIMEAMWRDCPLPGVVTLTRLASRVMDDDNLARSLKAVRDGVADALRIDDGDDRIEWRYAQGKAKRKDCAVMVEIEERRES